MGCKCKEKAEKVQKNTLDKTMENSNKILVIMKNIIMSILICIIIIIGIPFVIIYILFKRGKITLKLKRKLMSNANQSYRIQVRANDVNEMLFMLI